MYYCGFGARKTPWNIQQLMTTIAARLSIKGYILRSGGASGADTAFEAGSTNSEIFRPSDATPEAIQLASTIHPAWHRCNPDARKLHGRNSQLFLGRHLTEPVEFGMCWTPGGKAVGGSGQGIRLAKSRNIKVYNLFFKKQLMEFLDTGIITLTGAFKWK